MSYELGKNIKKLRIQKELTQKQLAEFLYITPQAVSKWEAGKALPDASLLPRLSEVLKVSIDMLFE